MSIFMNYEGISGESSDANHTGWIDIEDFRWGVRRRTTSDTSTRRDRESANAEISDLVIRHRMDSATPALFLESCRGRGRRVVLRMTKTGTGTGRTCLSNTFSRTP